MAKIRPPKPQMPLLRESPDHIYQRIVNRATAYARAKGEMPPPTEEGEMFYDMWYPLASEWAEQQQIQEYEFLQAFPVWADGEFLEAHGYADGVDKKDGEDTEAYRDRILEKKRTEEGTGRVEDYERWAMEIEGVGGVIGIEHDRNDVSIDLYLTNQNGQPVTPEFAVEARYKLEAKRVGGHDLHCYPAETFAVNIQFKLIMNDESKRADAITQITSQIKAYLKGRTTIVYQQLGALFWVDGVADYTDFTLNGATANINKPNKAVSSLNLVVLP
ncbi:baseplate J/gp47 family protein [Brevibacillus sp. 179-C9.3 HS]|uniref:baseplate J/gp47 family protein n=1 Tax=unclassified Brevibacillus TaxID=2684853 RepID=UPI0039A0636C